MESRSRTLHFSEPEAAARLVLVSQYPEAAQFLRRFPVQSVDFFGAAVSQDQWGVITRESCPLPHDVPSQVLAAQRRDQLKFSVAKSYSVEGRMADKRVAKVNVTPIVGPVRISRRTAYQVCPLVSAEIEQL